VTRHSHYVRVRLGGISIWRLQCTKCKPCSPCCAFRLALSQMRPEVARDALLATTGAQSGALCGDLPHLAYGALSSALCARPSQMVTALTRWGCPCPRMSWPMKSIVTVLTDKVYLPRLSVPRHLALGYTENASAAALPSPIRSFNAPHPSKSHHIGSGAF